MNPRPPLPPFTEESAIKKVQAAEDAWNSRDPERVSLAYIAISKTDFRIAEQKVLYKTGGSALRMVVESARTQT
jgi:nuclear transport factor 2 (NTF2) superfamily protein